ncbi:resolvase [Microvirga sp. M2]|uniref:resolvase n=1 Tax=Microvirga sp. M2 TaxID=3073270 RepID=UPI0039C2F74C
MTATPSFQPDLAGRDPLMPGRLSVLGAVAAIVAGKGTIRQERLSGIHNPWGHGIGLTDPWCFLELCESQPVIDAARAILGPDLILWDSELFVEAGRYAAFLQDGREGRYWPVSPLSGAVVLLPVGSARPHPKAVGIHAVGPEALDEFKPSEPLFVVRIMPATSRFDRDPQHPAHSLCMEEQVLINYANRPLWLISGSDKGDNDFVTGFAPAAPVWAG